MDVRFINAFVPSIKRVFETMVRPNVRVGKPFLENDTMATANVSGVIGSSGEAAGGVGLSFPHDAARKAASSFAGTEIDQNHPDFADSIGELANMAAGSAKQELHEMNVDTSLPVVAVGRNHTISRSKLSPRTVIPCECEFEAIFVEAGMEHAKPATSDNRALAGVS